VGAGSKRSNGLKMEMGDWPTDERKKKKRRGYLSTGMVVL